MASLPLLLRVISDNKWTVTDGHRVSTVYYRQAQ